RRLRELHSFPTRRSSDLYSFGTRIEARYGSWIMALLAAVLAVLSNSAQAYASGPAFLGMSGVVYGLFGFMWMRATLDPNSRLTRSEEHTSELQSRENLVC